MAAAVFLSRYPNGLLPYVRRHITVNKNVLSASLNKTFPSLIEIITRARGSYRNYETSL